MCSNARLCGLKLSFYFESCWFQTRVMSTYNTHLQAHLLTPIVRKQNRIHKTVDNSLWNQKSAQIDSINQKLLLTLYWNDFIVGNDLKLDFSMTKKNGIFFRWIFEIYIFCSHNIGWYMACGFCLFFCPHRFWRHVIKSNRRKLKKKTKWHREKPVYNFSIFPAKNYFISRAASQLL